MPVMTLPLNIIFFLLLIIFSLESNSLTRAMWKSVVDFEKNRIHEKKTVKV